MSFVIIDAFGNAYNLISAFLMKTLLKNGIFPAFYTFLRHLRFLLRSAEDLINKPPTSTSLQTETTLIKGEVQAIRTELAETTRKQAIDRAKAEEEKDGRQNAE